MSNDPIATSLANTDALIERCLAGDQTAWEQIVRQLGKSDRLLILRKPFDPVEVQQLAFNLSAKWSKMNP